MNTRSTAKNFAQRTAMRRAARALPVLGVVFSAFWVVRRIREKGVVRGGADAALDMTPFVGRLKALYEYFRGDLIPAKREPVPEISAPA